MPLLPPSLDDRRFDDLVEDLIARIPAHTPACCQCRRRRQQVMPLPHPISCGGYSHGMPVFSTKMIPVSAARSGPVNGCPPVGCAGLVGRSGSITAHNSSLTNCLAMPRARQVPGQLC